MAAELLDDTTRGKGRRQACRRCFYPAGCERSRRPTSATVLRAPLTTDASVTKRDCCGRRTARGGNSDALSRNRAKGRNEIEEWRSMRETCVTQAFRHACQVIRLLSNTSGVVCCIVRARVQHEQEKLVEAHEAFSSCSQPRHKVSRQVPELPQDVLRMIWQRRWRDDAASRLQRAWRTSRMRHAWHYMHLMGMWCYIGDGSTGDHIVVCAACSRVHSSCWACSLGRCRLAP